MNFEWGDIEHDIQTAVAVQADSLRVTLGGNHWKEAVESFLGVKLPDEELLSDSIDFYDGRTLIKPERFEITEIARRAFDFCTEPAFGSDTFQQINCTWDADIIEDHLDIFIASVRHIAIGGADWSTSTLNRLYDFFVTRLRFEQCLLRGPMREDAFKLEEIAMLADMRLESVRNHAGPDKPLRTTPIREQEGGTPDQISTLVSRKEVSGLHVLRWLTGRRNFKAKALDPKSVQRGWEQSEELTLEDIGDDIGRLGWLNIGSSQKIGDLTNWDAGRFDALTEGDLKTHTEKYPSLEILLGLDQGAISRAVERCPESR